MFEVFSDELMKEKKKKKKLPKRGETDSYPPPEYLVEPAKNDTGFFLVKSAFDKRKLRYSPGISY